MKHKNRSRALELLKDLVILLLACSMLYLLGRTLVSGERLDGLRDWLDRGDPDSPSAALTQSSSVRLRPMHLAVCHEDMRYGVQYDQEGTDRAYEKVQILFAEALSSAAQPGEITQQVWQRALCSMGVYLDFYYAVPFEALGDSGDRIALTGLVRRLCLAEDLNGGVSLFFINEEDGNYYSAPTTLSKQTHLTAAMEEFAPNGAQFAFEVPGLEAIGEYTLLTATPQPAVCASDNPLLEDTARVRELLRALSFRTQDYLSPTNGGQLVEQNDSLRLSRDGVLNFHTIGDTEFRFSTADHSVRGVLGYVNSLAQATVGAWSGDARLCLERVTVEGTQMEITFQYCLNGTPVLLPEGQHAARFMVNSGAVTDFTMYLRSYTKTEEVTSVLPVVQAAAAVEAVAYGEKELTLLYRDSGGEQITAGWVAVG